MTFLLQPRAVSAFASLLLVAVALCPTVARADDPPARVGRLGYMEGTVTFHNAGDTQWSYSALNYPVTAGLSFWTEPQSRAELQIGSSLLRMDSAAEIDVLRLDAAATQIELEQGTISFRIVNMLPGRTVEIETPHGAVSLIQAGTYRIDAGDSNTPTTVAALEGTARFIGPHSYLEVEAGEQATAIGDPANYTMNQAQTTAFDDWALQRDRRERENQSVKYVSREMTGYQDLDDYGSWRPSPQYGEVWVPQGTPAGWAPYREGHWAWVDPWGWTWIDDQPWGFAPFHYGRWAQVDGNWAWVPGQQVERPVYAPALVAFAAGVAFGEAVGWLPLGPGEAYHPTYRASPGYLHNVNSGAVAPGALAGLRTGRPAALGSFANHGAATFMSRGAFTAAQPVAHATVTAPTAALQAQAASTSLAALRPTSAARGARPATAATAPTANAGPSAASQAAERQQIQHAEPHSLATTGKTEVQERPGQATTEGRETPAAAPAATAGRPVVATPATRPEATAPTTTPAVATAEHPRLVEHERMTAPGPSAKAATPTPLRQEQLSRSLAAPAQERAAQPAAVQPQRNEAAAQQQENARTQAAAQQQAAARNQAAAQQAAVQQATEHNQAAAQHAAAEHAAAEHAAAEHAAAEHAAAEQAQRAQAAAQQAAAEQAQRAQAAAQQAAARAQTAPAAAPAFVKAEVPKPVQSAPLRPTQAGWNRPPAPAPAPAPPPAAAPKAEPKSDKDQKKPGTP